MKQILSLLRPHVLRTTLYLSFSKIIIGLCVILLWYRFVADGRSFGIIDSGFFALFVWFTLGAWFQYLALDGFRPFHALHTEKEKHSNEPNKTFSLSDLFGLKRRSMYAWDEAELEEDEMIAAKLFSNLLVAILFLIPSLIAFYFIA